MERGIQGQALVLGPARGVAARIARRLEAEGIRAELPGLSDDRLPSFSDPDAASRLREILRAHAPGFQYLHPGLSAWAERPELSSIGQQCGLSVVAPASRVLALFGNKLSLFQGAEEIGIPNLVIDAEPMHSLREIEGFVRKQGSAQGQKFPFILKTAKGGSRFGLTVIQEAGEIDAKLPLWLEQVRRSCGEVLLFAERYLEGSRLVSVPFARLHDGFATAFPLVDASLQSRHRKVIEFCPAQRIDSAIERKIRDWTLALAERCGYVGVGALEFLVDSSRAYLIGGTPRLNAAFHLWENVAGTHAVSWQLAALGRERPQCRPDPKWSSGIALRFYAEDSLLQLPQPGLAREVTEATSWTFPTGEAELDLAVASGEEIRSEQQAWIGTLWVGARDRPQAVRVAQGVLEQLWIAGSLQTNERFLAELLTHPWVREGIFHTGFVDEEFLPSLRPPEEILKIMASIVATPTPSGEDHRWAVGDQWVKPDPTLVHWSRGPERWEAGVSGALRLTDGSEARVCAFPLEPGRWQVRLGSWVMLVRRIGKDRRPRIGSLIPGRVHSILFREGAEVPAHEPLVIVESLGMLVPHALPVRVRIDRWKVVSHETVNAGQELADFEVLA